MILDEQLTAMIPPPDLWGSTGYTANNNKDGEEQEEGWSKVCSARSQELEEELVRQRVARKWYLVVIVLLYVGLLASFSLNVTLLLRKPLPPTMSTDNHASQLPAAATPSPPPFGSLGPSSPTQRGFAYTTPCLVTVPCEAGHLYDCPSASCQPCPAGSYQPQWGQTACWPCPPNTTTDSTGGVGLEQCKRQDCPFYTKEGVGIMETPNYPLPFPASASCRWRVSPGHTRRVLLLLPRLSLPSDCSASLTITRGDVGGVGEGTTVLSTCVSTERPTILTGQAASLSVEFRAGGGAVDTGFQLTALSIEEELGYLVDAIINSGEISTFPGQQGADSLSQDDKILLSRLLLLLNPSYQPSAGVSPMGSSPLQRPDTFHNQVRHKKPIIEVLEDSGGRRGGQ